MELRTLKYFLALANEGGVSNAAKALHITQPTLSRQLSSLEKEFGRQLYNRTHKGIELTEEGVILQRYAESIVDLADKAEKDIALPTKTVSGTVHIGAGETRIMGTFAQAMKLVREKYPEITFNLYSGTSADLMDNLVKGFYDLLLECELQPHVNMNTLELPNPDVWGIIVRNDDPLAQLDSIRPKDLAGKPLIMSRQGFKVSGLREWAGGFLDDMNVVAEYNLPLNTKFLVKEGLGCALTYEDLFDVEGESGLCFRELEPRLESRQGIVWRKTLPTKQTQVFFDQLQELCNLKINNKI